MCRVTKGAVKHVKGKTNINETKLGLCAWNMQGIISKDKNKFDDDDCSVLLNGNNIIVLTETHSNASQFLGLKGF